jgi:transcriptional regulator with XRE-family HTH domain
MLLNGTQNAARPPPYPVLMAAAKDSIKEVLAANTRALMDRRGWKQERLAKAAGLSQTHVGNVLRKEVEPTTAVIAALAKAFEIPHWLLLVPNLPIELLDSNEVPALLQTWLAARLAR